jgi:hypothetical protein
MALRCSSVFAAIVFMQDGMRLILRTFVIAVVEPGESGTRILIRSTTRSIIDSRLLTWLCGYRHPSTLITMYGHSTVGCEIDQRFHGGYFR